MKQSLQVEHPGLGRLCVIHCEARSRDLVLQTELHKIICISCLSVLVVCALCTLCGTRYSAI